MNYKIKKYQYSNPKKQINITFLPSLYILSVMFFISIQRYRVALVLGIITLALIFNLITNSLKRILEAQK